MITFHHTLDLHYYRDEWRDQAQAEVTLIQHNATIGATEALCAFWFKADPVEGNETPAPEQLQPAHFPDAPVTDEPRVYGLWRFDRIETPSLSTDYAITLLCRTADVVADVKAGSADGDELASFLPALEAAGIAYARPVEVWGEARMALIAGLCGAWSRAGEAVSEDDILAIEV